MKTDEQRFLEWCAGHDLKPKLKSQNGSSKIYVITPLVEVRLAGQKVPLRDDCTVYFNGGEWGGGTNWLWDSRLPWIKAKQQRFSDRAKTWGRRMEK